MNINILEEQVDTPIDLTINWKELWDKFILWCSTTGIKFVLSLVGLVLLICLINWSAKGIRRGLRKRNKDETVVNAVFSTYRKVLKFLAILLFLSVIGFDMTGISSIIASATVAIGLALQGSLSNIAGWVLIIFTRPFRLGDYIKAQGEEGTVEEINLFYTHLKTPDNKQITIPNGTLSSGVIVNYSVKDIRRLQVNFDIAYEADYNRAISLIKKVISNHPLVLNDPEPFIRVGEYSDSSVIIYTRVWVKNSEYWNLNWDLLEQVRKAFEENEIQIPYNKLDVNITKE